LRSAARVIRVAPPGAPASNDGSATHAA